MLSSYKTILFICLVLTIDKKQNSNHSFGSRNYIGQKFAMYEMKSVVSKFIRNFELALPKRSQKTILRHNYYAHSY